MKIYRKYIKKKQRFLVSEKISKSGLSLPSFTDLKSSQIDYICSSIKKFSMKQSKILAVITAKKK